MATRAPRAGLVCLLFVALAFVALSADAAPPEDAKLRDMLAKWLDAQNIHATPPECDKGCFVLSSMSLHGAVGEPLAFELHGSVLFEGGVVKVPLFGPSNEVRLDDLSLGSGDKPVIGFEADHYYLLTAAPSFVLRGTVTLSSDQMLTVAGPLVSLDAKLSQGRLVEGSRLSGLTATTLHFDPMTPESASEAESRTPKIFRLSRSLRIGKEVGFTYRLVMSQATPLGVVRLPLAYGEKVHEVAGAPGWTADALELSLPTTGNAADVTVSGVLNAPAKEGVQSFGTDERSAYEWWLVESDPDFRVELGGEAKLVDNAQSPVPPTLPTARTYLVQRGQHLEVDAKSLVRGEVLAAVARMQHRFVSVTAGGEIIGDETIEYDNNGLDHLAFTPAGQPIYSSTDGQPGRILHTQAGSLEMLVPLGAGTHRLRVQTLSQARFLPLLGAMTVPMSDYPLTTSAVEVTIGLPPEIRPMALLGGDHARWAFGRGDGVAALLGIGLACFGFRTRRTRILGSVATVGLWLVSREAFVVATATLFVAGAVFLGSRFLRGNRLLGVSAVALLCSMFAAKWALAGNAVDEPRRELFVELPSIPQPETSRPDPSFRGAVDTKAAVTPVSLSLPTSERYVRTSRQLVTSKHAFVPCLLYVTPSLLALLELAWLAVVGFLIFAHRAPIAALSFRVKERLGRRSEPSGTEVFPRTW
jgi:hypothetical protein